MSQRVEREDECKWCQAPIIWEAERERDERGSYWTIYSMDHRCPDGPSTDTIEEWLLDRIDSAMEWDWQGGGDGPDD